jgi:hypothetical protein
MDKVQNPSNSVCYTPSSEPYRIYLYSPLFDLGRFFSFLILYTVGRTLGRGISTSQGRYLRTEQHTSMPRVGFEPTIPAFELKKTVDAQDRVATMIDFTFTYLLTYLLTYLPLPTPYIYFAVFISCNSFPCFV